MSIKSVAKDWLPPVVVRALGLLRGGGIRFEGDFPTWEAAAAECTGYDSEPILAKVLEATLMVKRDEAAYERDSVLFDNIEYAWPVTAGIMWVAAQSGGRLDVLDFGGALGSSYFQNRAFLGGLASVRWSVIEQAHYVQAGLSHIQDDTLRFYSSIDHCLTDNMPNVVLLSSVLQYLPDAGQIIKKICNSLVNVIIIDRTPFNNEQADKICIQKVPRSIYEASYPMRIFSLNKFMEGLEGWDIIDRSRSPEGALKTSSGLAMDFQGFIMRRSSVV
jgi:putative methyltransferase (TIGR04325 family)